MAILSVAILVADLWALYQVFQSSENMVTKALWTILILMLPVVGLILWYLMGPKSDSAPVAA